MTAYFVTHPLMDKTAVVYAPSTEKARTTFLDWLERNGLVNRRQRQAFRRDMVASRLETPDVPADVELHYGYAEEPTPSYRLEPQESLRIGPGYEYRGPVALDYEIEEGAQLPPEPEMPPAIGEEVPRPRRMPIQEVMLRGFE